MPERGLLPRSKEGTGWGWLHPDCTKYCCRFGSPDGFPDRTHLGQVDWRDRVVAYPVAGSSSRVETRTAML